VTCCTAAVSTYEGLIICRIFLGIAEAGFFVCLHLFSPTDMARLILRMLMISPASCATSASGTNPRNGLRAWPFFPRPSRSAGRLAG
jgi:hypothetical protein